jgi:hypothetical protein
MVLPSEYNAVAESCWEEPVVKLATILRDIATEDNFGPVSGSVTFNIKAVLVTPDWDTLISAFPAAFAET